MDLFVVGDPRRLWLVASVREEYLGKLHGGESAMVTLSSSTDVVARGKVTNVGEQFDPTTHTMQVRITFDNPSNQLRPEMLAAAEIAVGAEKPTLVVPSDAVQQVDGQDVVFIQTSADHFVVRPVKVTRRAGTGAVIEQGLKAGERVVTEGAFVVKSELLRSAMRGEG